MTAVYVTGLEEMPDEVERLRPSHLVSIIQPEFQPERPAGIACANHLRVPVHDIVEPMDGNILPASTHVEGLIEFLRNWAAGPGDLLVHCYAGVSRSSAAALIGLYLKTGEARASALALRCASANVQPNRRIIELADGLLGCSGELIDALEAMGPRVFSLEPQSTKVVL